MKQELVGEEVTVSGPSQAIAALACETASGIANGAELGDCDTEVLTASLATAVADMGAAEIIDARIVLVESGLDITLTPRGGRPAATVEYRV